MRSRAPVPPAPSTRRSPTRRQPFAHPTSSSFQLPLFEHLAPRTSVPPPGAAYDDLAAYPHVSTAVLAHHACLIGQAGAAVVDSVLLARGIPVLPAPDGQSYDRLALIRGDPVTVQIKTTSHPGADGRYLWNIACGYRGSPRGRRPYARHAFGLLACVVLPVSAVLFVAPGATRVTLHPRDVPGLIRDPLASLRDALDAIGIDAPQPPP
ncbi:hypothetical protein [Jannaschia pohangensis]|uniref:hypothetical protein n=1 Tax=Jannaschia pohangensis TaxID=390807 RepID=UPI001114152F|nr:hypothetical protein [Jannaschia pohangensis]